MGAIPAWLSHRVALDEPKPVLPRTRHRGQAFAGSPARATIQLARAVDPRYGSGVADPVLTLGGRAPVAAGPRLHPRRWLFRLGPQAMAAGRSQLVFAAVCVLGLVLIL